MEFLGFINSDFDFFKKKDTMDKIRYDEKKEEVKRHFREFCYEIQKDYHTVTGGTLHLDKNFQGLNKNKNILSAISKTGSLDFFDLGIDLSQDGIYINLICPPDADYIKYEKLKQVMGSKRQVFLNFFKCNKNMFIVLYRRNYKKPLDGRWEEEFKFINNELTSDNYDMLLCNMDKLQPSPYDNKNIAGLHIKTQFSKSDAVKMGKNLASRSCDEIIKMLGLMETLKEIV